MEMTLGTWRIAIERRPPTTAELVRIFDRTARYWQAALRALRYPQAYRDLFARLRAEWSLDVPAAGGGCLTVAWGRVR